MTNIEAYHYLIKNSKSILCGKEAKNLRKNGLNNSEILALHLRQFDINIQVSTYFQLRVKLTGDFKKCEICNKNQTKLKNANTLHSVFNQFCSRECEMKWRSIRQSENNTVNRIKDRKKWVNNISIRIKKSILEGKFTPQVTNSWCHSRRKVILEDRTVNVRSSWEEKFLLKNPTFLYEKTRIPYIDVNGNERIYIVDFTDLLGNIYEIKPASKIGENSEKIKAAKEYANVNNVKFFLITENEL